MFEANKCVVRSHRRCLRRRAPRTMNRQRAPPYLPTYPRNQKRRRHCVCTQTCTHFHWRARDLLGLKGGGQGVLSAQQQYPLINRADLDLWWELDIGQWILGYWAAKEFLSLSSSRRRRLRPVYNGMKRLKRRLNCLRYDSIWHSCSVTFWAR
jgi:hypothetical protein